MTLPLRWGLYRVICPGFCSCEESQHVMDRFPQIMKWGEQGYMGLALFWTTSCDVNTLLFGIPGLRNMLYFF
jgi:hypothetical protein